MVLILPVHLIIGKSIKENKSLRLEEQKQQSWE